MVRFNSEKIQLSIDTIKSTIPLKLQEIQEQMFEAAKKERDSKLVQLETWDKFVETLNAKTMIMSPWCEAVACEENVKVKSVRV